MRIRLINTDKNMLFGQEEKVRIFKDLVKNGNLGQVYLFFGDRGIGKASFAKLLGYFLETGKFEVGAEPLIDTQIFSPNEKGVIGVQDALALRHFLWETPLRSARRYAVIDDAHALTPEAQGAMLKIVEEPPSKSLLVFVTYDAEALFAPLLSRLMKVYFPRLPKKTVAQVLNKEYAVPAAKAKRLSEKAFGSLGRALALGQNESKDNEPVLENEVEEEILALYEANPAKNAKKISLLLEHLSLLKRYNLNEGLARKAIGYELKNL